MRAKTIAGIAVASTGAGLLVTWNWQNLGGTNALWAWPNLPGNIPYENDYFYDGLGLALLLIGLYLIFS